jgi:hypothetical protein
MHRVGGQARLVTALKGRGRAPVVDVGRREIARSPLCGNVFVTGYFYYYKVDLGGGPLSNNGYFDIFLAKCDPDGAHLWSKSFGGARYDEGWAVATDSAGNVVITGYYHDPVGN